MKGANMESCKVCRKPIELKSPHFTLIFNKETEENGAKKTLKSETGGLICEDCGEEGLSSVLHNLKIIHDTDTDLAEKMGTAFKAIKISSLMKEYGITGRKIGTGSQFLAKCPFHSQENSFIYDDDNRDYYCVCEGLNGDIFSFLINYERDVNKKHITLKQAADVMMEKI